MSLFYPLYDSKRIVVVVGTAIDKKTLIEIIKGRNHFSFNTSVEVLPAHPSDTQAVSMLFFRRVPYEIYPIYCDSPFARNLCVIGLEISVRDEFAGNKRFSRTDKMASLLRSSARGFKLISKVLYNYERFLSEDVGMRNEVVAEVSGIEGTPRKHQGLDEFLLYTISNARTFRVAQEGEEALIKINVYNQKSILEGSSRAPVFETRDGWLVFREIMYRIISDFSKFPSILRLINGGDIIDDILILTLGSLECNNFLQYLVSLSRKLDVRSRILYDLANAWDERLIEECEEKGYPFAAFDSSSLVSTAVWTSEGTKLFRRGVEPTAALVLNFDVPGDLLGVSTRRKKNIPVLAVSGIGGKSALATKLALGYLVTMNPLFERNSMYLLEFKEEFTKRICIEVAKRVGECVIDDPTILIRTRWGRKILVKTFKQEDAFREALVSRARGG